VPQIVSLLPTASAAPAATPAPATAAVAPGAALPTDPTSPNFLTQFKAALKTIAKVVVQPPLTQRPPTDPKSAPLLSPVSEAPPADDADKPVEASMPDVLIQLGFAIVPAAFPVLATTQPPVPAAAAATPPPTGVSVQAAPVLQSVAPPATPLPTTPGSMMPPDGAPQVQGPLGRALPNPPLGQVLPAAQLDRAVAAPQLQTLPSPQLGQRPPAPQLGQRLSSPQLGQTPPSSQLGQTPPSSQLGQTPPAPQLGQTPAATRPVPGQTRASSQPTADLQLGQTLPAPVLGLAPTLSAPVVHQPITQLKPFDQPQPLSAQSSPATAPDLSAMVMLPPISGAQPPTVAAHGANITPLFGVPQPAARSGAQSGDDRSGHGRHPSVMVASIAPDGTALQSAPASDAAVAAAAVLAAPVAMGPLPVQIAPSQVVSQIAQHAEVIRLPGNRGLHIQLHPDDLGGVQVTVRYSPGGGVELHINAEHAATAALVQAGWSELRDSLASHGITADRLMMSVTVPSTAGQADLSGGDRDRSDPNAYGAGQSSLSSPDSQSQGQSRQDNAPQRTSQTWSGGLEPVASTDANPRVASATGTPSRIDYRV